MGEKRNISLSSAVINAKSIRWYAKRIKKWVGKEGTPWDLKQQFVQEHLLRIRELVDEALEEVE